LELCSDFSFNLRLLKPKEIPASQPNKNKAQVCHPGFSSNNKPVFI